MYAQVEGFLEGLEKPEAISIACAGGFQAPARCDLSLGHDSQERPAGLLKKELLEELARRHADELYRDDMTMTS